MHVLNLLNPLLQTPNIEVIKPPLPKTRQQLRAILRIRPQLLRDSSTFRPQPPGNPLLQNLHHKRRRPKRRFANQQMNMLRHNHIPNQSKPIRVAHLAKNRHKSVPVPNRRQQPPALIATKRNEVEMPTSVDPNRWCSHDKKRRSKHRPLQIKGARTPKGKTSLRRPSRRVV
jgi:hypothetical protein